MSLTGCAPGADGDAAALAAERVELMALLWQLLDGDAAYCANPRLLTVARLVPGLETAPATDLLRAWRETGGRDRLIKAIVSQAHAQPVGPGIAEIVAALDDLSARWEGLAGHLAPPLQAAYRAMRERADPLCEGLDPARDLAAITGERDALAVRILPSLFLPPPQAGRHSALVAPPGGPALGTLHYGHPLDDDPTRFGITRFWLMGGAWHYAVTRFVERHGPAIAAALAQMPATEAMLGAALAEHREPLAWPGVIAEHVVVALKCLLCRAAGLPEAVHHAFARAQGLALFGWVLEWLAALATRPADFVARYHLLPQELDIHRAELVALVAAASTGAESIAFALASRRPRVVVLPDDWGERLRERIARRWSAAGGAVLRESEWRNDPACRSASVIAFGRIGHDALVDDLLDPRAATLGRSQEGGDVLVSLLPAMRARAPWRIAVAVHDREVAGRFAAEQIMGLLHRTARFAGGRFVGGEA